VGWKKSLAYQNTDYQRDHHFLEVPLEKNYGISMFLLGTAPGQKVYHMNGVPVCLQFFFIQMTEVIPLTYQAAADHHCLQLGACGCDPIGHNEF